MTRGGATHTYFLFCLLEVLLFCIMPPLLHLQIYQHWIFSFECWKNQVKSSSRCSDVVFPMWMRWGRYLQEPVEEAPNHFLNAAEEMFEMSRTESFSLLCVGRGWAGCARMFSRCSWGSGVWRSERPLGWLSTATNLFPFGCMWWTTYGVCFLSC